MACSAPSSLERKRDVRDKRQSLDRKALRRPTSGKLSACACALVSDCSDEMVVERRGGGGGEVTDRVAFRAI